MTQGVKNNIHICIRIICLFQIIFIYIFVHQKNYSLHSAYCHYCHNLNFVTFEFLIFSLTIWVLSQFEFRPNLSFVTLWVLSQFEFCPNLSFIKSWVSSHFELLSFVTIWFFVTICVFEFYHNLSFWILSPSDHNIIF